MPCPARPPCPPRSFARCTFASTTRRRCSTTRLPTICCPDINADSSGASRPCRNPGSGAFGNDATHSPPCVPRLSFARATPKTCSPSPAVSGVDRFVVLAAGLDTFALRQSHPLIEVVEIDHPATQQWKRQLLAERNIDEPPELAFLPVNFEEESLADVWIDSPTPDCISWLGTTYYLTRDAISSTLTTLAKRTQPGSHLVLDYWREPATHGPLSAAVVGYTGGRRVDTGADALVLRSQGHRAAGRGGRMARLREPHARPAESRIPHHQN